MALDPTEESDAWEAWQAKNNLKYWKLRTVNYNTFNGKTIIQIWKDDELRGSFTIYTEDELSDLEWWKKLIEEKDGNNSSDS